MSDSSHHVEHLWPRAAAVHSPHPSSEQAWGTQVIAWELEQHLEGRSIGRQYGVWKISSGVQSIERRRKRAWSLMWGTLVFGLFVCFLSVFGGFFCLFFCLFSFCLACIFMYCQNDQLHESPRPVRNTCCLSELELFMQAVELMTLRIWIYDICLFICWQLALSFITWRNRWTANVS